ncbi:MAG: alpha-glucan family phosphorylase [Chloroflexota bacterium]
MIESNSASPSIAYFSMEMGLDPEIPTYSGGLGVLAGDSLRAAADLRLPMVGITLVHRKGYFRQRLDAEGHQTEIPDSWSPEERLQEAGQRVTVQIEGRTVHLRAWRYEVQGTAGNEFAQPITVYLLDTNLPDNDPQDQRLTDELYGGDTRYRLSQEVILGMGGVAMLRALGYNDIRTYHMNEGHSGLLVLSLLEDQLNGGNPDDLSDRAIEAVKQQCVFTIHTPVPAGHDVFTEPLVEQVLGEKRLQILHRAPAFEEGMFDLTAFVMYFARKANGVSKRHAEITRGMFPGYEIAAITNGVHVGQWLCDPIAAMLDRSCDGWRRDNRYLRYAADLPLSEIRNAHAEAKKQLFIEVQRRRGVTLDPNVLTIGFARRATGYKRGDLIFSDIERLKGIVRKAGPLQVIYSGKAHPRDESGKLIIEQIFLAAKELEGSINVTYVEDYDMGVAKFLCAGVDLWLNNPQKPLEASGTSGMKAAMNGVPSLSVLDGWWVEGCFEGVTGWAIGDENPAEEQAEVDSLYDKLEGTIMPLFYHYADKYTAVMRGSIAVNGEFFSAQRMMSQYYRNVYRTTGEGPSR